MTGEYADELAVIGQALADSADLLIYGCNFGEGVLGKEAAARLAELTGADIAASDDPTGSAALGGDWELEYQLGSIETPFLISAGAQNYWDGLLAAHTVADDFDDGGGGSTDYSGNDGTQNWTNSWQETEANGATSGNLTVDNGRTVVSGYALNLITNNAGDAITREVDLTGSHVGNVEFLVRAKTKA